MSLLHVIFVDKMLKVSMGNYSAYIGGEPSFLRARMRNILLKNFYITVIEDDCVVIRIEGQPDEVLLTKKY